MCKIFLHNGKLLELGLFIHTINIVSTWEYVYIIYVYCIYIVVGLDCVKDSVPKSEFNLEKHSQLIRLVYQGWTWFTIHPILDTVRFS